MKLISITLIMLSAISDTTNESDTKLKSETQLPTVEKLYMTRNRCLNKSYLEDYFRRYCLCHSW